MTAASLTRMWEARAADGHAEDLLQWALAAVAGRPAEVYRSTDQADHLVVVLVHDAGELPAPPPALVARAPMSWRFERVGRGGR